MYPTFAERSFIFDMCSSGFDDLFNDVDYETEAFWRVTCQQQSGNLFNEFVETSQKSSYKMTLKLLLNIFHCRN